MVTAQRVKLWPLNRSGSIENKLKRSWWTYPKGQTLGAVPLWKIGFIVLSSEIQYGSVQFAQASA